MEDMKGKGKRQEGERENKGVSGEEKVEGVYQ